VRARAFGGAAFVAASLSLSLGCHSGQVNRSSQDSGWMPDERAPFLAIVAEPECFDTLRGCAKAAEERQVADLVASIARSGDGRSAGLLLELLAENHPLWHGRGPLEAERLRAWILARLAETDLDVQALPRIATELAHGHRPRVVGAAARAAAALGPEAASLRQHLLRFTGERFHDDEFDLEVYLADPPFAQPTTARREVALALAAFQAGNMQACCKPLSAADVVERLRTPADRPAALLHGLLAADLSGGLVDLGTLRGQPLALTFLYTRCPNPERCPLTAARLVRLHAALRAESLDSRVRLAVITLDPGFDSPERLERYLVNHGLRGDHRIACLRLEQADLEACLANLGGLAGFGRGQVNAHAVELHTFDQQGRLARSWSGLIWDEATVLADLRMLVHEASAEG
jgi:cytochrome oxidase Cu insertion factor (SCO1/SenC/PrrC family)